MIKKLITNRVVFLVTWIVTTAVAWYLGQYSGFHLRSEMIGSLTEASQIALTLFQNGILLGILVGLVQWGVLRARNKIMAHWIIATVAGYALGLPLGFSIPLALAWGTTKMMKMQLIGEGGNAFLNFPLLSAMFLSGAIIAILQWISAKASFQNRVQAVALWVLGSALAWASAFFLASSAWAAGISSTAQSAVAGATVGMITGFLLILLMSSSVLSTRRTTELVH